jgi:NADH-quinone oxidoreductase subunit G
VCVGTSCFVRGSQAILQALMRDLQAGGLEDRVDLQATFCFEACNRGPTVRVGDDVFEKCTYEKARGAIETALAAERAPV